MDIATATYKLLIPIAIAFSLDHMDPTLKRAYARLLSLGYPKEPLSKVKFHSLAYARLAELPLFLVRFIVG